MKKKYRCTFHFNENVMKRLDGINGGVEFDIDVIVTANSVHEAGSISSTALLALVYHPSGDRAAQEVYVTEGLKSVRESTY